MNEEKILFEDKDVRITDQNVTIKCYYFPIGTSKKIPLKDIVKVQVRDLGMAKMRLWGMDATAWGYWLPGDLKRCSYDQFIAVYTGKSIVPSFTTENTTVAYNILMSELQKIKHIEEGNNPISSVFVQERSHQEAQNSMERPIMQE